MCFYGHIKTHTTNIYFTSEVWWFIKKYSILFVVLKIYQTWYIWLMVLSMLLFICASLLHYYTPSCLYYQHQWIHLCRKELSIQILYCYVQYVSYILESFCFISVTDILQTYIGKNDTTGSEGYCVPPLYIILCELISLKPQFLTIF